MGLAVAVVFLAGFALAKLHSDHQRCVSRQSMTVVNASDCQNTGIQGAVCAPGNYCASLGVVSRAV